jgi:hypothetical protein
VSPREPWWLAVVAAGIAGDHVPSDAADPAPPAAPPDARVAALEARLLRDIEIAAARAEGAAPAPR